MLNGDGESLISNPKNLLIELFYIGMAVVRTDARTGGRTDVRSRGYKNFSDA